MFTLPFSKLIAFVNALFADTPKKSVKEETIKAKKEEKIYFLERFYVSKVTFKGNNVFSDAQLAAWLDTKKNQLYSTDEINAKFWSNSKGSDVATHYFDKGYLLFDAEISYKEIGENTKEIEIQITEGDIYKFNKITVSGGSLCSKADALKMIQIQAGENFCRNKVISAHRNLMRFGYKSAEEIQVIPQLNRTNKTVDIEFKMN
jgi:outer membrane protein insertion porin family